MNAVSRSFHQKAGNGRAGVADAKTTTLTSKWDEGWFILEARGHRFRLRRSPSSGMVTDFMTLYINGTRKVKDRSTAWYLAIGSIGHTNVGKSLLRVSGLTDDILRLSLYCKHVPPDSHKDVPGKEAGEERLEGTRDSPR